MYGRFGTVGPAVHGCAPPRREKGRLTHRRGGALSGRHGPDTPEPGDETIVDTAEFTLDGRAMRTVRQVYDPVRQVYDRVERAGCTVRVRRHADIPGAEMTYPLQRADDRRDEAAERGFTMASGGSAVRVTDSAVMRSARTGRASCGRRCPSSP